MNKDLASRVTGLLVHTERRIALPDQAFWFIFALPRLESAAHMAHMKRGYEIF